MIAVLIMLASAASRLTAPDEQRAAHAITTAISSCLSHPSGQLPASSNANRVPPGLIEGMRVSVTPVAGSPNAFAYEGRDPRVITCGVAIYGPVSRVLRRQVTALISSNPGWKPHSTSAYDLSKPFPNATELYWGDLLAPSMRGVALLSRTPSTHAPTIEIEYHAVLVQ